VAVAALLTSQTEELRQASRESSTMEGRNIYNFVTDTPVILQTLVLSVSCITSQTEQAISSTYHNTVDSSLTPDK
jgi:hypothetical protein